MPACLEIFSLSVSHKARGLGLGALLCNHIEKLAKQQNVDLFLGMLDFNFHRLLQKHSGKSSQSSGYNFCNSILETSIAQFPAINLYKKLGYECSQTWFHMNSILLDFAYWGLGISCTACHKKLATRK